MDLTPLDVRKKKEDFRRVVRGYDPAEVDGFLDVVSDRLEDLVARELRLREQSELLREQLAAFQDRERALNEALVTAQELREEARAQAEKTADLRVREAERQAEAIRRDAELAVQGARRGLDDLRVRRSSFLRSLRATLEHFLSELNEEERRGSVGADDEALTPKPPAQTPEPSTQSRESDADSGSDDARPWSDGN
ncbi:MAG: DivIVA domain-containing protein [Gemmatimonadota bacterium]